jgi:hypothetical protein
MQGKEYEAAKQLDPGWTRSVAVVQTFIFLLSFFPAFLNGPIRGIEKM